MKSGLQANNQFDNTLHPYRFLRETHIKGKSSLFRNHGLQDNAGSAFNIWNLKRDLDGERHWYQAGLATPSGLALEPIENLNGNTLFPLLHPRRPILRVPVVLWPPLVHAKDPVFTENHRTCLGRALPCYKYASVGNSTRPERQLLCCFGASIDFLKFLQKDLGFDSEIYLSPDGQYGKFNASKGAWNGVVGEIISGKADLGLDLSVSMHRLHFIEMVYPSVVSALNILVQKEFSHGEQGNCNYEMITTIAVSDVNFSS